MAFYPLFFLGSNFLEGDALKADLNKKEITEAELPFDSLSIEEKAGLLVMTKYVEGTFIDSSEFCHLFLSHLDPNDDVLKRKIKGLKMATSS